MKHSTMTWIVVGLVALAATAYGSFLTLSGPQATLAVAETPAAIVQAIAAPVHAEPALYDVRGLTLGATTRGAARAWALEHGATCDGAPFGKLRCEGLEPSASATGAARVELDFDRVGKLATVTFIRPGMALEQAQQRFAAAETEATERLGEPAEITGACTARMGREGYSRAHRVWMDGGVHVTLTATNLCERGIQIRERYRLSGDAS